METFWQFEIAINLFFQVLGSWLLLPMKAVSFLGQEEFYLLLFPAIYWCLDSGVGVRLIVMMVLSHSINVWIKIAAQFPRPYWIDPQVKALAVEASFGMPSNHSQSAMALWGGLARIWQKRWLLIVAIAVIVLTGISRIYLGVHFASQVIVGWVIGGIFLWAYFRLEAPVTRFLNGLSLLKLEGVVLLLSVGILAVNFLIGLSARPLPQVWVDNAVMAGSTEATPDPFNPNHMITVAGTWLGFGAGAAWRWRKYGPLPTKGSWQQRGLRYLVGAVGLLVLYLGLGAIFPRSQDLLGISLRYFRYTLLGLWISILAPLVFQRVKLV
jgi:membrane-associated phospholipid phosphatase